MNNDEIINAWKREDEKKQKGKKQKRDAKKAAFPENPAGQQELSDDILEQVEGGAGRAPNVLCPTEAPLC